MTDKYQPWTWSVPAEEHREEPGVRQDAFERVSGQAVYTRDLSLPGMLYAKILPSPYAHAKIMSIDTSQAESLVGVRDILRYDDPDIATDNVTGGDHASQYNILTLPGTSDFYQHPMGVVVVADSEEICDRALKLIKIVWREFPFVIDFEEAAKTDAPKIMPEVKRLNKTAKEPNIVLTNQADIGDVEKGFAEADKIIEYTIRRGVNSPAGVEAQCIVAQWRGDFLDLYAHHQWNPMRNLSAQTNFRERVQSPIAPWSKMTLTLPYQSAGFGGLSWLAWGDAFARLAAIVARRAAGKPVKLVFDESNFYCGGDEAGVYNCKVGAKKDGTITAAHWHMVGVRNPITDKTYECTKIPNLKGTQVWPLSNVGHLMCYRHGAHGCVPHGIMIDRVAAELEIDPTEVALINDGCRGHDWNWVTEYQKENNFPQRHSLKEVIDLGKKAIGWDSKWHAPGTKKLANGRMHGLGFVSVNEWRWTAGSNFACLILTEGKVTIVGLRADMGIDSESGFRRSVASELGVKYEDTVIQGHRSDNSAYNFSVAGGSMGTVHTVPQLILAARELKQKVLQAAVQPRPSFWGQPFPPHFPDKKPEDLDVRDGRVFDKANPSNSKTVAEVTGSAMWGGSPLIAHPTAGTISGLTSGGKPDPIFYVMGRQAHFIEVEVDVETGTIDVTNIACVNDVGHIFNRQGAEAQQYGGAIMGLGRNTTEEKIYCPQTGVALNLNMLDYRIGTMNDYPAVQCILNESHLGYSAYGAYGIGENVGAATSALTSHAVYNAIGKRLEDFPITPDKVLRSLGKI